MYFYLPDFYYKYNLNLAFVNLLKAHPEYFYDNVQIGAIYGSFPGCIWNGGRAMTGGTTDFNNIKETIESFNKLGIPIRFTFTNCLLEAEHCYDTYSNLIVQVANNGMNEILVNSEILETYLKSHYPNFKYIFSTTKCERDIDTINNLSNQYHLLVTDYRDNNNFDFMKNIKNKNKIELLVNAVCNPNCTRRLDHYRSLSETQLNFKSDSEFLCPDASKPFYDVLKSSTTIHTDDILNKYLPMGFKNFKIEGRTLPMIDVIEAYVYYMIKPEYKDLVRYELIRYLWH